MVESQAEGGWEEHGSHFSAQHIQRGCLEPRNSGSPDCKPRVGLPPPPPVPGTLMLLKHCGKYR